MREDPEEGGSRIPRAANADAVDGERPARARARVESPPGIPIRCER